jgi:acyl dehydratase
MSHDTTHNAGTVGPLYLDDLRVGQQFVSGSTTIDAADIKRFAGEFDPQPFHLDEDAAHSSPFGGLVASGWHTAALTMRLLVEGGAPIAGGIVGIGGELSWLKPTRPGDMLKIYSEVIAIKPSQSRSDRGVVTIRSETRNQRNETVQVFVGRLIVPRRANRNTNTGS